MIDINSFFILKLLPVNIRNSLHFLIDIWPSSCARSLKTRYTQLVLMRRSSVYIFLLMEMIFYNTKMEKFHNIVRCPPNKWVYMLISE